MLLLAFVLLTAFMIGTLVVRGGALVDDAFISYRYAQRWAQGLGLTWNDGSAVEGFSNPLWTLSLGGLARLGWAPHLAAVPLSMVFALGTVALVAATLRRMRPGAGVAAGVLLGLVLDSGFPIWCSSGLETAQTAFAVTLWMAVAVRPGEGLARGALLGLVSGLVLLTRPEAVLWVALGGAWLIWGRWASGRTLVGWMLGALPLPALWFWRRFETTGHLVPNTFFAKMESGAHVWQSGGGALLAWLGLHGVALGVAAILLLRHRAQPGERGDCPESGRLPRGILALAAGWIVLQGGFVILAGGDWMGESRYLAPLLPVFYLGLGLAVAGRVGSDQGRRGAAVLLLVLLAHAMVTWTGRDRIPDYTLKGEVLGRWLAEVSLPGERLAVTAAGAIPYFSGLPTLDVLGLNDEAVAGRLPKSGPGWMPGHARFDLHRLVSIEPDWIVWDLGVEVNRARMRRLRFEGAASDSLDYRQALLAMPEFRDRYRVDTSAPRETQDSYTVFRRR